MTRDLAGNSLRTANRSMGTLNTAVRRSDRIGGTDPNDYYMFRLGSRSQFALRLKGLKATADVALLNSKGKTIRASQRGGLQPEVIRRTLNAGRYFVRVYSGDRRSTSYILRLSATPDALIQPPPPPPPTPQITVTGPVGGSQFTMGEGTWITWNDNISEDVRIDLYQEGSFYQTIASATPSQGAFYWVPPTNLPYAFDYQIKVSSTVNGVVQDLSDGYFSLRSPGPDLVVNEFTIDANAAYPGSTVPVSFNFANTGSATINPFSIGFYLSSDATISSTDYLIESWQYEAFDFNTGIGFSGYSLTLPTNENFAYNGNQSYYIGLIVDNGNTVVEMNETNNQSTGTTASRLTVVSNKFTDSGIQLPAIANTKATDWGDYDADGDLDFFLAGDGFSGNGVAHIYRNDGGVFTNIQASITGASAAAAWGDYDNDGDLDLLTTGPGGAKLYRNTHGTFGEVSVGLDSFYGGTSVQWGDYDNDGDLDLVLADGWFVQGTKIYRNDAGTFVDIQANIIGGAFGSASWGDYDKDLDLDLLLSGYNPANGDYVSRVYRNDGGTFVDANIPLAQTYGESAWGDYDNDGDLDIVLSGRPENWPDAGSRALIYDNIDGTFQPWVNVPSSDGVGGFADYDNDGDFDLLLTGSYSSSSSLWLYQNNAAFFTADPIGASQIIGGQSASWGDYDNDGDLDILAAGSDINGNLLTQLLTNNAITANLAPSVPTGLAASVNGNNVLLSWQSASDSGVYQNGVTYNLRIGTTPGGSEVMSPMSTPTGSRLIPEMGNAGLNTSWSLKNLAPGTYYWSVQSVDNDYLGSAFATTGSFTVGSPPTALPDLLVIAPMAPNFATVGTSIDLSAYTYNNGTVTAASSITRYWLSNDTVLNPASDIYLGEDAIPSLNAGVDAYHTHTFTYNTAWGTGTKYILFQADGLNSVSESNESNNVQPWQISINPPLPVVTLSVSDATASETSGNPGQFTFTRSGSTGSELTVFYTLGGTAVNGSDYGTIGTSVTFAAGAATTTLNILPSDDNLIEGNETVTLMLSGSTDYGFGASTSGTVTITDNDVAADPGNTLGTAEIQASPVFSRSQQVSSGDRNDIYRFTLTQSGVFSANLTGLSGDADIRLIRDFDSDGTIDTAQLYNTTTGVLNTGEILAWQWERGTTSESLRRFLSAGTYFLQVSSYNNQTANYNVTTSFTASTSDSRRFSITPVYDSAITANGRATIQKAIDFWMAAIPFTSLSTAHDLVINFLHDPTITEPTLARGGYRNVTVDANGKTMPTTGQVTLSTGYLDDLNQIVGFTPDTITHEIAHVLGIVGLLNNNPLSNTDLVNESTATYTSNSYAGWAYGELKGTFTPTAIPLTQGVDSGSNLTHWQEEVFGNEMMTHLTQGAIAAVSSLSLAALRDLGWNVNFGAAQPYALPQGGFSDSLGPVAGTVTSTEGLTQSGTFGSAVGSEHLNQVYRFEVTGVGDLVASLTGLSADANMRLIRDVNGNGMVEASEVLAISSNSGTTAESFNFSELAAGTYYIQVAPGSSFDASGNRLMADTPYTLSYALAASAPARTTTLSPVERTWTMTPGSYSSGQLYSFVVGDRNIDDLLRFNFNGTTNLSFSLTGLTANANMELIYDANNNGQIDAGEIIRTATNAGSTSETITASGLAAGSYYFRVYRADSSVTSTPYSFNLVNLNIT